MIRCFTGRGLACLAVIGLLWPCASPVRAQFTPDSCLGADQLPVLTGGTNGVTSVVAGDLDADGDTDIATASFGDDRITWFKSGGGKFGGERSFTPITISTEADGATSVAIADLDGSCSEESPATPCLDVISASSNDNKIAWYVNNGQDPPKLTEVEISTNALLAQDVFAEDVDMDGDLDVLSASFLDNKIAWYENDGGSPVPGFTEHVISTEARGAASVFAVDMDGDMDVDVLSASRLDDKVAWYENLGPPAEGEEREFVEHVISSADLDPDAPSETIRATSVYAADLNGDGAPDVVVASNGNGGNTGKISWFASSGDPAPTFTSHDILPGTKGASEVFVADVDGDGPLDVLAAYGDTVTWFKNDGAIAPAVPMFAPNVVSNVALGAMSVFASDLNDDDALDLQSASSVPGRLVMDDKVAWYPNPGFEEQIVSTNAQSPESIATADFDADGKLDVVYASSVDDTIAWERNEGGLEPVFTRHVISVTAEHAISVFAADLDGSCAGMDPGPCQDVIAASFGDGTGGKISWFQNDGADPPMFPENLILQDGSAPTSVFAADVDSDGDSDVIAAIRVETAEEPDRIAWFENDGASPVPGFTEQLISTNVDAPRAVFAADVDNDGDIDVLSASTDDDKIALFRNDGNQEAPGFAEVVVSTDAIGAMSVAAADLDNDCDEIELAPCLEVLSASSGDNKIALHEIRFGVPPDMPTGATSGGAPAVTAASGEEPLPTIEISPDSLDFGGVFLTRVEPATLSLEIKNNGMEDVLINSILSSTPEFTPSETSLTVPALQTISIDVAFEPSAAEIVTGTLEFTSNDVTMPLPGVSLAGNGFEFGEAVITTDARFARFVSTGDVDNDGQLEVLSASSGDGVIAIYFQQETEPITFVKQVVSNAASNARSALARDLNGDCDQMDPEPTTCMDIVTAFFFEVAWHRGNLVEECNDFDVNDDTRIGGTELGWFYQAFGMESPTEDCEAWWCLIDYNGDDRVDGDDLAILSSSGVFGKYATPDSGEPLGPLCNYSCVTQE